MTTIDDILQRGFVVFFNQEGKNTHEIQKRPAIAGYLQEKYAYKLHNAIQKYTNYMALITAPSHKEQAIALSYDKKNDKMIHAFSYSSYNEIERYHNEKNVRTSMNFNRALPILCFDVKWGGRSSDLYNTVVDILDSIYESS